MESRGRAGTDRVTYLGLKVEGEFLQTGVHVMVESDRGAPVTEAQTASGYSDINVFCTCVT